VALCPMSVFELDSKKKAVVKNLRNCTMCRECIREENGFSQKVEIGKKRDHYVFTIESVGQYSAIDIFKEAIKTL
jgi:DNA-directed RNA polymerases I and III subunit RPAC1